MNCDEKLEILKMIDIPSNTILCSLSGSRAYGLAKEDSDYDLIGCCIGDMKHYFGIERLEQYQKKNGEVDATIYEIRKFFRLLLDQNPTVLSSLFVMPDHFLIISSSGKEIIKKRDSFLSKAAYKPFSGYAYGQLKRMTHHDAEKMTGKRKAEFEEHGFSAKNAMHLIRLLKMGIILMKEGILRVYWEDNELEELKNIRSGKWSLDRIQKYADELFKEADDLYRNSKLLPEKVDYNMITNLLESLLRRHFKNEI